MSASYGVTHPSQPNYIALFSGSQHGITTNKCRTVSGADNLGRQLLDAGLTFTGYAESMPRAGYTGCKTGEVPPQAQSVGVVRQPARVGQPAVQRLPQQLRQAADRRLRDAEHVQRHARLLDPHR